MKIWTEKYKPSKVDEIPQLQATMIIRELIKKNKPILLSGPTGSGKTTLVHILAKELDYELLEINASDVRDKESILKIIGESIKQECLFKKSKLILIDEVDNISSADRGCIPAIISLISELKYPLILTAIDIEEEKIKALKSKCNILQLTRIHQEAISKILATICEKEKIIAPNELLTEISLKSNGDIRAAINDLQVYASAQTILGLTELTQRDSRYTVQEMLKKVFRSENMLEADIAIDNTDIDLDESILWLEENIPLEYKNTSSLAKAFDSLSMADVFRGRIRRRQNWGFIVYQKHLIGSGVNNSKSQIQTQSLQYKRSTRPLKIWLYNQKYGLKKEIAVKLAPHIKVSTKHILKNFPLYKRLLKVNREIFKKIKLTDEETFFLYN